MADNIQVLLSTLTAKGNLRYLIHYGNLLGLDRDLCAVFSGHIHEEYQFRTRGDDLFVCNIGDLEKGMLLFDPIYTEPLLNGNLLYGDGSKFSELKSRLSSTAAGPDVKAYLLREARSYHLASRQLLDYSKECGASRAWLAALFNLTYVASYCSFADHYEVGTHAVSLEQLLIARPNGRLHDIHSYYKTVKRGGELIPDRLFSWVSELDSDLILREA